MSVATTIEELWAVVAAVPDPEMPPLDLGDLGILRGVRVDDENDGGGEVVVTITPTYSGCPAVEAIEAGISEALAAAGHARVRIERVLAPAWTTDWITDEGRAKLALVGIAPPRPVGVPVAIGSSVACPRCGSTDTVQISRFGATACKALLRCRACQEPFDHFKEL